MRWEKEGIEAGVRIQNWLMKAKKGEGIDRMPIFRKERGRGAIKNRRDGSSEKVLIGNQKQRNLIEPNVKERS